MEKKTRPVTAALVLGAAAFFLLGGYEFVRSVSTSLFIGTYGAERLPVVMALSPVGTLALLYGYGRLLSLLGGRGALLATSLLSGMAIAACYLGILGGHNLAIAVLYVLREAYIVLIIEQYWSYINSSLSAEQAKKINGPVCGIASLGAIGGGLLVGRAAPILGSETLLLFAALSLLPAALLAHLAYRLGGEPAPAAHEKTSGHLGLALFRREPTLIRLALLIGITQVVSTVLDLRFSGLLAEALPIKDERTAYLGNFYALLNSAAFLLQFIGAPLLLHFFSLRRIHLAIPLLHLGAATILLGYPTLAVGAGAYLLFKAVDYSIFRAGKELFYIPLSFDARYRAKEVIDAFGYRAAKGGASALLALAAQLWGRLPGATYPLVAAAAAVGWVWLARRLTQDATNDSQATDLQ